ncbi:hypothetical protein CAPTEDRAFT_173836 [Capitella teleta]|uniref:SRCR domain-containing protein n=1 Tax=Capitella teleta TaxID=283909 RepID=R7TZ58_CAPTE|nr:hypothetical protein CAPTEDRAFT_173832 [Capitella teleta]ELT98902.1 hypothetical protein CAPTEDRAFT_173836 [Capitella teleta]|eukprot:ELT98901.1 hypothetical protein CAPTEDRAFT_173832 [Capitella teleta]
MGGYVKVYYQGSYHTVCDDEWDDNDARVVCRNLGFSDGVAVCCAAYGSGYEAILLDNVRCTGSEANLAHCAHNGVYNENCSHSEDAGVLCY